MSNLRITPITTKKKKQDELRITPILTEEEKKQQAMSQSKVMAPAPAVTTMKNNINNQITTNISNKIVTGSYENEIHNKNMSQATKTSISNPIVFGSKKENNSTPVDTSDFIYNDTGKKYGDYYYDNYELYKDMPIYEQHGKYYLKTNKGYEELGRLDKNGNVAQNVMTTKEAEKEELEKAKKLGFKDNNLKITSQDYDDAQDTFKELQKQYKLSDKELNNWIKTGELDVSHISIQTNKMNSLKQKAEDYRTKINSGKIKQYEQKFDTTNQIYMDTHDMSDDEKQHYISTVTGKKDPTLKNENTFFKGSSVFDDGYQFGDVSKATLGTVGNAGYSFLKGTSKFVEGTSDFAENLIGSGLESVASDKDKKDVKTFHNNIMYTGYKYGNKDYWYDEKSNKLYDKDWNRVYDFDINQFQKKYTYSNKVAEFGRQMKEQTVPDESTEFFDETLHGNDLRKASVLGNKSESILESMGQAVPLMGAGGSVEGLLGSKAAVATTSGLTFANTYGNAKTEAIRNGATEDEAIKSAFIQASAETISEQFFDSIPGAKSAGWGEKLVGKVGNSVEKYMGSKTSKIVMKTLDISGEGFEEIISNMLTAGGNDIVHFIDKDFNYGMENQSGNILDDMTKAMTSQDSMDSFISALLTSAILNAGSSKINSSKRNQVINEIVRTYAEENNISFKEAKSRLRVDGDNVEFNESVNAYDLPNNSSVEQQNINSNINNQVNENIENSMARAQNNNISNKSDIPLMKEEFVKQVDSYLNKTFPSNQLFNLGETPEILQKIGLKNNPITMKQSALNHIIADGSPDSHLHNISIENIKRLPEAISSPLNVLYSNSSTKGDSVVVITDLADNSERPIIVSILIDDNGRIGNIDFITNSLTSAYGKRDYDDYMKREIEKGNMLYDIDEGIKKELAQTRVQFPTSPNSLNEQVIPTDKIENQSVNRFVEQPVSNNDNTTNFSKSQIAPLPQYNMQQKTKNDTTKIKPPIAQKYQKNTIDEKKSNHEDVIKVQAEEIANQLNSSKPLNTKERRWIETSIESDVLKDKVFKEDLDVHKINYKVQSNKKSLNSANSKLELMGYEKSVNYVQNLLNTDRIPTASDVALAQRVVQEAAKKGDTKLVQDLIMDVAILGTELGQATQALSMIGRLTPEGQLKLYSKIVHRAKMMGDKSFQDVEITPEMVEMILNAYDKNGNYDQDDLNARVEQFKQEIADQLKSSVEEKIDAWRYLSMLGNPKTHIRNIVSNVAMKYTIKYKNLIARTIESVALKNKPMNTRTKTWKKSSKEVKEYARNTATEMKNIITGESKYNEKASIESKKRIFKFAPLEAVSNFNSNLLEAEDWFFSKSAFISTFQEYLTANGIETMEDIKNNPDIVEEGKEYSVKQAEIATFRQYSKLASSINRIERNNKLAKYPIKATIPFKKTPINVAKAGLRYSPLGLIKNVSYDIYQLKKGNINASEFIDNLSQGISGTSLTLIGYALAKAGILTGALGDDKDDKYLSSLGKQGYSIKIGNKYYSLSWLSPTAMPLMVGANFFEQLEEREGWDMNVLSDTLAKTLDPLSEMSFVSSLTDALNSYGESNDKIKGMGESFIQSYTGQFFPTLFSQFASVGDDTKRSTKASSNSSYKFGEQTVRSIMYKIPGLRNQLEPSTDMWGKEVKQNENIVMRALESFLLPYNAKEYKNSNIDKEILRVYRKVGNSEIIPGFPRTYIQYDNKQYRMSAKEYTQYKKTSGTSASTMLNMLINTSNYKNSTDKRKTRMIKKIYDYSKDIANEELLSSKNVKYKKSDFKYSKNDYKKIVNHITSSTQYKDDD